MTAAAMAGTAQAQDTASPATQTGDTASEPTAGGGASQASGLLDTLLATVTHEEVAVLSLILSVLVFAALAAILYLQTRDKLNDARAQHAEERRALQARADRGERFLGADRQIMVAWPADGGAPEVESGTFAIIDAPEAHDDILSFEKWIEPDDVVALDSALHALRKDGLVFDMLIATRGGATIEASGLISGRHAVLRMREATNLRHELHHLRAIASHNARDAAALKTAAERASFPVWVRDTDGQLVWVNTAFATQSGFQTPESAVTERAEFVGAKMLNAMAEARHERVPFSDVLMQADEAAFRLNEVPVRDGFAGIAMPATPPGLEADATTRSLRASLDQLSTGLAHFDSRGRLTLFNAAFCDLWGWDRDWLETSPEESSVIDQLRADKQLPDVNDYRAWRDGLVDQDGLSVKRHSWHLSNNRMLNVITVPQADGSRTFLFENKTESRELETRVVALNQTQRETLDSLSEGIVVFGSNGRVQLSNPQFREMWSLDATADGEGAHIDTLIKRCQLVGGQNSEWSRLKGIVTGYSDARRSASWIMALADGRVFQTACVPLPDGGTLVVFTDISDSQRIERALRERNDALEQAARIRNSFVGKVSYELRQPLQNIIGFAEVLSQPELAGGPDNQREYAGHILSESSELLVIVNNILDLASIDAGTFELERQPIALLPAIQDAVSTLHERLRRRNIEVQIDTPENAPDILADPQRLRQILFNLMSNAVGFSPDGAIVKVQASFEGDVLTLVVSDRGPGIPETVIDRVFERFESQSAGTDHRGAGLGLSLVKSFVELHNGRIWIDSSRGSGTKVHCELPQNGAVLPDIAEPRLRVVDGAGPNPEPETPAG